jgi:hypothetical protein
LPALTRAQRAFAAAEILARAAADMVRLPFVGAATMGLPAFTLAHLAFAAAEIFTRPAADIVLRPELGVVSAAVSEPPKILVSSFSNCSICSLMVTALLSCATVKSLSDVVIRLLPIPSGNQRVKMELNWN